MVAQVAKDESEIPLRTKSKKRKRVGVKTELSPQFDNTLSTPIKKSKPSQPSATSLNGTLQDYSTTDLSSRSEAPFIRQTWSMYVPLSPISMFSPVATACAEHFSPLILNYYPPFKAVVLAYNNPRLSTTPEAGAAVSSAKEKNIVLSKSVDEFAANFVWATAEFTLFRPQRGHELEGWINLQTETHIGLVCWNYFTASVERKRMPKDWQWAGNSLVEPTETTRKLKVPEDMIEELDEEAAAQYVEQHMEDVPVEQDLGHFRDAEGNSIQGLLKFRVVDIEQSVDSDGGKAFIGITGTLLESHDEAELCKREERLAKGRNYVKQKRRMEEATMSGARQDSMEP